MVLEAILIIGGAYLIGSLPFGVIFTRWLSGIDPREHGSRNIGFTNVLRVAGWLPGLLTLLGDMGKGFLAVVVAPTLIENEPVVLIAGLAAVIGHNHSLFLKFKGGKGVATGFGVLLGLMPWIGLIALIVWAVVVVVWRFSSLGAIVSYCLLPILIWWTESGENRLYFAIALSLLVLLRHRSNLFRLWQGVEPKMSGHRSQI